MAFFNLPNSITLLRIALIPLFAFLMLARFPRSEWYAGALFLLLSLTDFADGYLARKKKQITDAGKILDPIADKLLIITALLLLIGKGVVWWMALAIIIREALLTAIRLAILDKDVLAASWLGKLKTFSQIIAITSALLGFPQTYWIMVIAVTLTLISGIDYLIAIRKSTGHEIVNIPNGITFLRFLLIIPFVILLKEGDSMLALLCFGIIALLDRVDGVFARLTKQKTRFGEIFDTFTDWVVIIASFCFGIIYGYFQGTILWWAVGVGTILALSKLSYFLAKKDPSPSSFGRLTVGLAYVSIAAYVISFPYREYIAWATIIAGMLATLSFLIRSSKKN